jgi:hypothetical protein
MLHERELTLDELLSEPIIVTVMERDGYTPEVIRHLVKQVGAQRRFVKRLPYPAIASSSSRSQPSG